MNKIHSDDMIYILNTFEMSEMDEFQKTLILELFFDRFCLYGILRHDYTIFKKVGSFIISNNFFLLLSKNRIGFFYTVGNGKLLKKIKI